MKNYFMNNIVIELILFFIIIEHIVISLVVIYLLVRRLRYARSSNKFLYNLLPSVSFEIIETQELYLELKIFIETPEVGVYLKRLYRTQNHMHKTVNSLLYIIKGKANVVIGTKHLIIKPGEFLYVPSSMKHNWKVIRPFTYVEYIEIASPSFTSVSSNDTVWI